MSKGRIILFLTLLITTSFLMSTTVQVYATTLTDTGEESEVYLGQVSVDQMVYPYVDCDTMSNVFAFDISKGQNPIAYSIFLEEVSKMGHTLAVWNITKDGVPPPCVKKLMVRGSAYNTGNYTMSEADAIESWVIDGGRLFLLNEWYGATQSTLNITESLGIIPETDPSEVTDTDDYIDIHPFWIILDEGNFNIHPIFGLGGKNCHVSEVRVYASGWYSSDYEHTIRADTDGTATPSGAHIAYALEYGSGKVFLIGDSNWLEDSMDHVLEADNLQLGINVVRWLNDMPICPEEPVGGELLPLNTLLNIAPYILAIALLTLSSSNLVKKY
jgi:hypothetical protein